jgi:DNA-binding transcriptional LysR family regulator
MEMEIRTLRAFVEVVRQGGFSQAAKVVFATQSTVSKAVKQLEDEIGVLLLDRLGHRSTLTSAGEIVYRRALRILAERDDLISELDEVRGLKRGLLRLGLPPMVSSILFAPLLAIYRKRYPGIEIRLVENGIDRLEEILSAGDIDFAASTIPVAEGLEWQSVRNEPGGATSSTRIRCTEEDYRSDRPKAETVHPVRPRFRGKSLGHCRMQTSWL